MIFVHNNHATKGGRPEGVLMAKASDTDIICTAVGQYNVSSPRDWSTPAVNCICGQASTGDGFISITVRLH